jgi:hypothetical protein
LGQQLKSVKRYLDARGVKNCWFAYFSQSVVDPASYGIPCTPLYTAEVRSPDTPPAVDGPVLISSGVLSGFETGVGFFGASRRPSAMIPRAIRAEPRDRGATVDSFLTLRHERENLSLFDLDPEQPFLSIL